jgi:hypothetical protein
MFYRLRNEFYAALENWKKDEDDYYAKMWTCKRIYHRKGEFSIKVIIGNSMELGSFSKKIIITKTFTTYAQSDKSLDVMRDINKFNSIIKLMDKEFNDQTEEFVDEITDTIWDEVMKDFLETDIRDKLIEHGITIDPQPDQQIDSPQKSEVEQELIRGTLAKLKSLKDNDSAETKDQTDGEVRSEK